MIARAILFLAIAVTVQAADLSGTWEARISGGQLKDARRVKLTPKDGKYEWNFLGSLFSGGAHGNSITFQCTGDGKKCGELIGHIKGAVVSGTGTIDGIPIDWSLRRPAPRPAAGSAHYEFTPTVFYREFSGTKDPALHLFPGDTVHTQTVDAGGKDAAGAHRVFGGNPLTGPFYIEGAMPGDTLVVKFIRVRLNRDSAESGDSVVGTALDPYEFRDQPKVEKFDSTWKLDRENGIGSLKNPTERLKNYKVPLHPMIGCVGVAPSAAQSFRAGYLGDWGGNMDYNKIVGGTTVFLPVNVPGALLYVGDGHAAQGDGELAGDALETSVDIEFSVDVQQDTHLQAPRFENDQYVMTSGIGNSLQQALQQATSGMSRYLAERYKLNPAEIGVVLDTAMQYDIAEVVDPQVHIVAKLPRKALAGLKTE